MSEEISEENDKMKTLVNQIKECIEKSWMRVLRNLLFFFWRCGNTSESYIK